MPLADGTPLIASDGALMLDTDGSVRLADGVSDACCCGCPCDPDAAPSSVTVDLTNLNLDDGCIFDNGANPTPCGSSTPVQTTLFQTGSCLYSSDGNLCRDGWTFSLEIQWDVERCRWTATISLPNAPNWPLWMGGGVYEGPPFHTYPCDGTSTDPTDPSGTYTPVGGCPGGSFEVL
jgi:hypothetical protein